MPWMLTFKVYGFLKTKFGRRRNNILAITKITNLEFGKMVQAAAAKLNQNAEFINSLNVFPVPDGDTGTNMSM